MLLSVNGQERRVDSLAEVFATESEAAELIVIVEQLHESDQFAQAAGSMAEGFVVGFRDRAGVGHVTKNQTLRPSTVVAMLDGYASGQSSWADGVSWADDSVQSSTSRRVVLTMMFSVIAMVAAVLATSALRTYGSVRYLCGRDGGVVDSVSPAWGSRYGPSVPTTCTFADGQRVELADVVGGWLDFAEAIGSLLFVLVLFIGLWLSLSRITAARV